MSQMDWRSIEDDREKYQAYLCSREWSVKKNAVHERAKGMCERCRCFAINAVHHLTYERKYREELEDLQGICKACHDFTHGKSDFDPEDRISKNHTLLWFSKFLLEVKKNNATPPPFEWIAGLSDLRDDLDEIMRGMIILKLSNLYVPATHLCELLPFAWPRIQVPIRELHFYLREVEAIYRAIGFDMSFGSEFLSSDEDTDGGF